MRPYLDPRQTENLDILIDAIVSLQNREECQAFLRDLFTVQELISFSQRLQVARLLLAGETYEAIRQKVPVSSSTITRINTALQFGAGGYRTVTERLDRTMGPRNGELEKFGNNFSD